MTNRDGMLKSRDIKGPSGSSSGHIQVGEQDQKEGCCYSVAQSGATLCDPMDGSTPGFPVPHCLLEFALIRVH